MVYKGHDSWDTTKKTYYQIIEVNKKASQEAIKSAYRRLAMLYHPDKNQLPEAEEMFKKIAEAYSVLSDPSQRKQYDLDNEPRTVLRRQKQEQMWQIIRAVSYTHMTLPT